MGNLAAGGEQYSPHSRAGVGLQRDWLVARRESVYVASSLTSQKTAKVYQVNLATGKMEFWKAFGEEAGAGVSDVGPPRFSSDGTAYAYIYVRTLSEAYVVTGLK